MVLTAMDAVNPESSRQDLPHHIRDELGSDLSDELIITLNRLEHLDEVRGDDGFGEGSSTLERRVRLNGHDSGDDGDGDTGCTNLTSPFDKDCDQRSESDVSRGRESD